MGCLLCSSILFINDSLRYLISDKWQIKVNAKIESDDDKGAYTWSASAHDAGNHPYPAFGTWDNTERQRNANLSAAVNYLGKHFNFTSIHNWYWSIVRRRRILTLAF